MLTPASAARVRTSRRWRSQRSAARPGRAPCRPAAPDGSPADAGGGRSSRSPPSTPVRTHPGWHDETQRAPGEEEIDLWRDDAHILPVDGSHPRPCLNAYDFMSHAVEFHDHHAAKLALLELQSITRISA